MLDHLKTERIGIIIGINTDLVMSKNLGPAFDARDDGRLSIYVGFRFNSSRKQRSDDAGVDKGLAFFKFPLGVPLRHSCRGPRAAGRPVDRFVSIKDGVS